MTDLVEQLRAQSALLREKADIPEWAMLASWYRSLAGLIDGMLAERERLEQNTGRDFVTHMDNFVLPLLRFHVSSVIGEVTA